MSEVLRYELFDGRLLCIGLHAVPDAQLYIQHDIIAAVPFIDGFPKLCGGLHAQKEW